MVIYERGFTSVAARFINSGMRAPGVERRHSPCSMAVEAELIVGFLVSTATDLDGYGLYIHLRVLVRRTVQTHQH